MGGGAKQRIAASRRGECLLQLQASISSPHAKCATRLPCSSSAECTEGVGAWERWHNTTSAASGGTAASADSVFDKFAELQELGCTIRLLRVPQPPRGSDGDGSRGALPGTVLDTAAKLRAALADGEPGLLVQCTKG